MDALQLTSCAVFTDLWESCSEDNNANISMHETQLHFNVNQGFQYTFLISGAGLMLARFTCAFQSQFCIVLQLRQFACICYLL